MEKKNEIIKITNNGKLRKFKVIIREIFRKAIKLNEGNKTKTAKELNVGRGKINRSLKK